MAAGSTRRRGEWARLYPPMSMLVVGLVLAVAVLPSSLTLPQANPSTTLELAPVPPEDEESQDAPDSNASTLGLGSSGDDGLGAGLGDGGGLGTEEPPPLALPGSPPGGTGSSPVFKQCVGNPPRQTEDPLSPPCVGSFSGSNGGATYQGVTKDVVRVLLYFSSGTYSLGGETYNAPSGEIRNMDQTPPEDGEMPYYTAARAWQRYFNDRYQTYGRHVQLWVQFSTYDASTGRPSPASRQADAAQAYSLVRPFAVLDENVIIGAATSYLDYMAQHGVLSFSSTQMRSRDYYRRYPGLQWSYLPTFDQLATNYAGFTCKKVVGKPTDFAGSFPDGTPRKLGLVMTSDPNSPDNQRQAELVKSMVEKCGGVIADIAYYPSDGYGLDTSQTPAYAVNNMQRFASQGITTILWPAGLETKQSQEAQRLGYQPEWLLGGIQQASNQIGQIQDQQQWANAWIVTPVVYSPAKTQTQCYQAYRSVDRTSSNTVVGNYACGGNFYQDLRQLFTGIQVAGPKLGRASVDKGFHAIPDKPSTSIQEPACYYLPRDYTCVKDTAVEWWDPAGKASGAAPGCWRMLMGGKRFNKQEYPPGNVTAGRDPSVDLCNEYTGGIPFNGDVPSG